MECVIVALLMAFVAYFADCSIERNKKLSKECACITELWKRPGLALKT